jgi:hypothetical protein
VSEQSWRAAVFLAAASGLEAAGVNIVLVQLNPPLPLETPKGAGWAHFVIDYGPEGALLWVVFMDEDGACWTVPNFEVRMSYNWTMGRRKPEDRETERVPAAVKAAQADGAKLHVLSHPAAANLT